MSFSNRRRPLALTLWYATLFVAGSLTIVVLTYVVTAASLAQRDSQIVQEKLGEYATVYARGGLRALAATVQAEQRTSSEPLIVRVVDRGAEAIVLSDRGGWDATSLEVGSIRLRDGTLVQVGKSTEARRDILSRFRASLGLVTLSVFVIALGGGWVATQSALRPIRRLNAAVRRIIATGRTDERVPVGVHDDELDDLTRAFNVMLDRIEGLVTGMRGALDNVAHDLRTPLTRVRGIAETALAAGDDPERQREALADCVEETDRVLVMLNTLMDISEAESGAMPLTRERVPLSEVARRAVELYRDVADAKNVELAVSVDDEAVVWGDRIRLEQVAANLVDNAVKYTAAAGRVEVRVRVDDGRGELRVADTGIGIPRDEQRQVWNRLFRGDSARTERGLGLGLSLVKAVIEAHGGSVALTSEPSRGTTFDVLLPLASRDGEAEGGPGAPPESRDLHY